MYVLWTASLASLIGSDNGCHANIRLYFGLMTGLMWDMVWVKARSTTMECGSHLRALMIGLFGIPHQRWVRLPWRNYQSQDTSDHISPTLFSFLG
jgi:hypothetical protein